MKAHTIFAVSLAFLGLVSGCAAESTDAASSASEDLSAAPAFTPVADATPLANPTFQDLRAYFAATTFAYADIQGTEAFSFAKTPSMSDADALVLAKAIAKADHFKEVKGYTLNAAGTPAELKHLAERLEHEIRADDDAENTPKLTADMLAAFSRPGSAPGGAIKVFTAVGPGDDHDGDNQDREAIFLDTASGEALVLQGQSIDM